MTTEPTEPTSLPVDVTPANVVHLTAIQLADAVAMVKPHLGTDGTYPMLSAYRLDARDGAVWLSATDRFSAAAARIEPYDDPITGMQKFPANFHATIPGQLVHRAVSIFKAQRRFRDADPRLAIRVTTHQTVIEERTQVEGWEPTRLADVPSSTPPDILNLLHSSLDAVRDAKEWGGRVGLNARYLNRFAGVPKVVGGRDHVTVRKAPGMKPLLVTCGDAFIGALMPIRFRDDDPDDLDKWIARVTPKAAKS